MSGPKPDALPLGDTPLHNFLHHSTDIWIGVKSVGDIKWLALSRRVWGVWEGWGDRISIGLNTVDRLLLLPRKIRRMILELNA